MSGLTSRRWRYPFRLREFQIAFHISARLANLAISKAVADADFEEDGLGEVELRGAATKAVVVGAEVLILHTAGDAPVFIKLVVGSRASIPTPQHVGITAAAGGAAGATAAIQGEGLFPMFVSVYQTNCRPDGNQNGELLFFAERQFDIRSEAAAPDVGDVTRLFQAS